MDKYSLGTEGEVKAKRYLLSLGYRVIAENVNFPGVGELDLVCVDGNTLVFVEVRARADRRFGDPLESVTKSKIRRIVAASRRYLYDHSFRYDAYRYDVIGILGDSITHIKEAFFAHW